MIQLTKRRRGSPQITIRFPEPLYSTLVKLSEDTGKPISNIVRESLEKYLVNDIEAMQRDLEERKKHPDVKYPMAGDLQKKK